MAVRRESVRLELDDAFSRGMLTAAAATKTLEGSLHDLDGTSVGTSRSLDKTSKDTDRLSTSAVRGSAAIDKYSGRMGILLKVAATLGPALVPLGAVGIAGVAGLANQFAFAGIAAGTAVIAFQGVGDALKAVNEAALEPSVANLEKAQEALAKLSPAGRGLVAEMQSLRPVLDGLRDTAQGGLFPGLIEGFESLERLAPSVDAILSTVSRTLGDLFAAGADSLASDRWADFFAVIAREARPTLTDMASAIGSVAHGMSELWEAFAPLNRDFGSWLADSARSFDQWAQGLSETQGFEDFITYIRENGPLVAEATGAIATAVIQIVEAAAPLGGPVLRAITGIANALSAIADSPLGTPIMAGVTAISALSLASTVATASVTRLNAAMATLGVTSRGAGLSAAAGGGAAGGPIGLVLAGVALSAGNAATQFKEFDDGAQGLGETLARSLIPGIREMSALEDLFGFGGGGDNWLSTTAEQIRAQAELADATSVTRRETRRFGNTFFAANKEMLANARASERVEAALKEQREAVSAAGDAWGDYSAKVQFGKTSADDLMRRWDRIAEASADFGENVRDAIERGINPKVIKDVIDALGPRGAAGALEDFANASGEKAAKIESSFHRMSRGVRDTRSTVDALNGLLSGNGLSIDPSGIVNGARRGKQSITELSDGVSGAILSLHNLDREKPQPTADLNIDPLRTGVASAERLLTGLNGHAAHTYIYVHTVRTGNDTAGGPAPLGSGIADGGTVRGPRLPYGDKVPAYLAPGEEVISNRFGQADRHRALLKAINSGRMADGGTAWRRASERAVSSGSRSGGTQRIQLEVHVVGGEMDLSRAKAQLGAMVRDVSRDQIDQHVTFQESQR